MYYVTSKPARNTYFSPLHSKQRINTRMRFVTPQCPVVLESKTRPCTGRLLILSLITQLAKTMLPMSALPAVLRYSRLVLREDHGFYSMTRMTIRASRILWVCINVVTKRFESLGNYWPLKTSHVWNMRSFQLRLELSHIIMLHTVFHSLLSTGHNYTGTFK